MNTTLIAKINQYITDNGTGEITGPVLNLVLRDMVNQTVAELTYSALSTLITNGQVIPGTVYKITDRGDRGILVMGVTPKSVSREGIRIMLCPKTYLSETLDGNVWKGIWHAEKTVATGNLFIWGGRVWKNLTGAIGSTVDPKQLDNTNWQLIPKASFSNKEYVEKAMSVSYDFANDWIENQSIAGQLSAGMPWEIANGNFVDNYIDLTDWNNNDTKYMNVVVQLGVINNADCGAMINVHCTGIYANYQVQTMQEVRITQSNYEISEIQGVISNNHCKAIVAVNQMGSVHGINHPDDWYAYHTDDKSVYVQCDFEPGLEYGYFPGPLDEGNHAFINMVLQEDVALTEIVAMGVGLTGEPGAKLSFGLEMDDETYLIATTLADLNNGVKVSVIGNKTTARYRRFKVAAIDGDVSGGILKIAGKYL